MTTSTSLFRAILENPRDDALRLVYSDALEEEGRTDHAAFVRTQIELATGDFGCTSTLYECVDFLDDEEEVLPYLRDCGCDKCKAWAKLKLREDLLFAILKKDLDASVYGFAELSCDDGKFRKERTYYPRALVRRGFVEEVSASTTELGRMTRIEKLFSETPILKFTLEDKRPGLTTDGTYAWWFGIHQGSDSEIHEAIFNQLRSGIILFDLSRGMVEYDTQEEAMVALSDACVSYGRKLAGLSPLEVS